MHLKQHPSHKEIFVSDDGRVFRELLPSLDSGGYHQIRNGEFRLRKHVLVCETYHGPRPQGMVVRHLNGVPGDDDPTNLRWGTQQENCSDTVLHDKTTKGVKNKHARLTDDKAREIRQRRLAGESGAALAEEFCVSQQTVCDIYNGRSWKHVK